MAKKTLDGATAPAAPAALRRVRAKKVGYAGTLLRDVGEVFLLAPAEPFSTIWMEDVGDDVPITRAVTQVAQRPTLPRLQPNAADEIPDEAAPATSTGDTDVLG
jgi:hypothetical protein